ncbi:MAG: hypothetical protein JSS98_16210 [Bacteroidetes bacterium]|nr:hypothetical protein [Bacteroidota bacterium]
MGFSVFSCKKQSEIDISTNLQQSWNVVSIKTNYRSVRSDSTNTYVGIPNDIYQFNTDGSLVMVIAGDTSIYNYRIHSNTRLLIDREYYSIQYSTVNSIGLYAKVGVPETYYEIAIALRK